MEQQQEMTDGMFVVDTAPDYGDGENVVLYAGSSEIGMRSSQQDAVALFQNVPQDGRLPTRTYAVLCDGMGGMASGEKASAAALEQVMKRLKEAGYPGNFPVLLKKAIYEADDEVYALQDESGKRLGAGTTLTAVVIEDNRFCFAAVGDSRIYLIRDGVMHQLTADHNVMYRLEEQIRAGQITIEEANATPKREALISFIGMGCVTLMNLSTMPFLLHQNDYILLCSDGLYRTLSVEEILTLLQKSPDDIQKAAKSLTDAAIGKGLRSQDNTTVALLKYI